MAFVELIPAHVWDCDKCGQENFTRCVVVEMTPDEMRKTREEYSVDPTFGGVFLTKPAEVTCSRCGEEYQTLIYGENGGE